MRAVFWTIVMCCVLASCTPVSWRDTWAEEQLKKLEIAESLWQAKNLQHYQMTVSRNGWCEQEFDVNGGVTTVISDTCFFDIQYDMDYIFSFIKRRIEYYRIHPQCASNGCTCDGPLNIDVQYDPENGYPTVVQERPLPEYRIKKYDPPTWCEDYNLPEGIELFVTSFKTL